MDKKIAERNIKLQARINFLSGMVFDKNIRTLLIYRSLSSHVAFFFIIILPVLVKNGMQEWFGGIITALAGVAVMLTNKFAYKIGEKKSYNFTRILATVSQAILLIIAGAVLQSRIAFAIVFIVFNFFEGLWMPARNQVLVEQTKGVAIATTRSIVFSIFALYTTLGKQFLSLFPVKYALIGSGIFILLVNIFLAKKILLMQEK